MDNAKKQISLKSAAKALGVKSTFAVNDRTVMTSFGRGNEAIVEKYVTLDEVSNQQCPENYTVDASELPRLKVTGKRQVEKIPDNSTYVTNPLFTTEKIGQDQIGLKDQLEKRYFAETFPEDNIHIQVIYNILDIEKLLSYHIGNIVYTINNIHGDNDEDILGAMLSGLKASKVKKLDSLKKDNPGKYEKLVAFADDPRISYFGNAFFRKASDDERYKIGLEINEKRGKKIDPKMRDKIIKLAPENLRRTEEEIYQMLCILSEVRMFCVHDGTRIGRASLYNFEDWINQEYQKLLTKLFQERITSLDNFAENASRSNFRLIFDAEGATTDKQKKKIARDYYHYAVLKDYKNVGFSVKVLRETILDLFMSEIKVNTSWDSVRSKLYTVLDLLILGRFSETSERRKNIINDLRGCLTEDEKQAVYAKQAVEIWPLLESRFVKVKETLSQVIDGVITVDSLALSDSDIELVKKAIEECKVTADVSQFSKVIYLMTLFLDGKEINDLLTTLVNKFDNIFSLLTVLDHEKLKTDFVPEYNFFSREKLLTEDGKCRLTEEMRVLSSIARMTKELDLSKREMFYDAAKLLGCSKNDTDLKQFIFDAMFNKSNDSQEGKKLDTGFRKFIANNMVKSWRFRYVIRYIDPADAKVFTQNDALVKYVLKDIPETMIDRYCRSLDKGADVKRSRQQKIDFLTKEIMGVQLLHFQNVNQKANAKDIAANQRAITIMSLYLNVIYQVVKNLVNINTRYLMAFHALERDAELMGISVDNDGYLAVSNKYLEKRKDAYAKKIQNLTEQKLKYYKQYHRLNRINCYLQNDLDSSDEVFTRQFRNDTAHQNALRSAAKYVSDIKVVSSYYALYHYCEQRYMEEVFRSLLIDGELPEDCYCIFKDENGHYHSRLVNGKCIDINDRIIRYMEDLMKYQTYSKNFVKSYCAPFEYNLPRYKNLVVEGLFDQNRPGSAEYKSEDIAE